MPRDPSLCKQTSKYSHQYYQRRQVVGMAVPYGCSTRHVPVDCPFEPEINPR